MERKRPPHTLDEDGITRRAGIPTFSQTRTRTGPESTDFDERETLTLEARDALLSGLPAGGKFRFMDSYEAARERGLDEGAAWRLAWIDVQEYYADEKDAIADEEPPEFDEPE